MEAFFEWKSKLLGHSKVLKHYLNLDIYEYKIFNSADTNFVKNFLNSFLTVPLDKAANYYVIICKKNYIQKVEIELSNTDFYAKTNVKKDPIIKKFFAYKKKM